MYTQLPRHAWRSVVRHRLISASAAVSLGTAIALTIAMFAAVNQLVLRPPDGVRAPGELFRFQANQSAKTPGRVIPSGISFPEFQRLRASLTDAEIIATSRREISVETAGNVDRGAIQLVSDNYFDVLGVRTVAGHLLSRASESGVASREIVLTAAFWRRAFGEDHSVLGSTVHLNGVPYVVVGISADGFIGLERRPVIGWVPLTLVTDFGSASDILYSEQAHWLTAYGRRTTAPTLATITARVASLRTTSGPPTRRDNGFNVVLEAVSLNARTSADIVAPDTVASWLLRLSLLLLLTACVNVSVLLVARGFVTRSELVTKLAIGASPNLLTRELVVESAIVVVLSVGVGGLILPAVIAELEAATQGRLALVDWRVQAFAVGIAIGSCAIASLVPVLVQRRALRSAALTGTSGRIANLGVTSLRVVLAVQAALAFTLLCAAGVLVDTVRVATALSLGVQSNELLIMRATPVGDPRTREFLLQAQARLRAAPFVRAAALSAVAPLYGTSSTTLLSPKSTATPDSVLTIGSNVIEPGYFRTLGMRIVAGRDFNGADRSGSVQVAVVNQTMARLYWPGADPINQCLYGPDDPKHRCSLRVVGVVSDAKLSSVIEPPQPYVFTPVDQLPPVIPLILNVRTVGTAASRAGAVRAAIAGIPSPSPIDIETLEGLMREEAAPWRYAAATLSAFALLSIAYAAFGVYCLSALVISARRRELAIRLALGVTYRRLTALAVRDRLSEAAAGIVVGAVIVAAAGPALKTAIHLVSLRSLSVGLLASGVVGLSGAIAVLMAMRLVGKISLSETLRS